MYTPGVVTSETTDADRRIHELLRAAARWHLLGRLFECPTASWRRDVERLACEVADSDLEGAAAAALATATEQQYHSVFGPGGPASPREVSYYDAVELGSLMSELAGYYDAFGYRPSCAEPPDHVAVEAGFIAYLCFKEAYALSAGNSEHAAVAAEAADRFRADHLARMAAPIAALLAASDIPYLTRASTLLAAGAGKPTPRTRLPVIQPSDDGGDDDLVCGDSLPCP